MEGIGIGYIFINLFSTEIIPVVPDKIFVDTTKVKADNDNIKADDDGSI